MDKAFFILGGNTQLNQVKFGGADSFSDRLSSRFTVILFTMFAIIAAATWMYADDPIGCFCPAEWTSSQVSFARKVCWTQSTYFVPWNEDIPRTLSKNIDDISPKNSTRSRKISYYQWITLILCLQAFLFYLPRSIWKSFNRLCGISVHSITDAAVQYNRNMISEDAEKILKCMTNRMGDFLFAKYRIRLMDQETGGCNHFWSFLNGNYLVILYVIIKVLYLANAIGQLFLLNMFLGDNYHLYGIDVGRRIVRGSQKTSSYTFPLVTICIVRLRKLGENIHTTPIQCVLPMNLFYEMMFIVIWFWLVFVMIVSAISLLTWTINSLFTCLSCSYTRKHLERVEKVKPKPSRETVDRFVRFYLQRDGFLILKLVARNAGDWVASELLAGLWDHYHKNIRNMERRRSISCRRSDGVDEDGRVRLESSGSDGATADRWPGRKRSPATGCSRIDEQKEQKRSTSSCRNSGNEYFPTVQIKQEIDNENSLK